MLTIEGIFRDGHVELLQPVSGVKESKVLVTFVENKDIDLSEVGIDKTEAAELRAKFDSFEDWNDPSMDIYNDYENAVKIN